jgi:hypothetical protein
MAGMELESGNAGFDEGEKPRENPRSKLKTEPTTNLT